MSEETDEWWLEKDEVVKHPDYDELHHCLKRLEDVDTGRRMYELHDATHTTVDYWFEEDAKDVLEKTDVIVKHSRKPIQVLDGRLLSSDEEEAHEDRHEINK